MFYIKFIIQDLSKFTDFKRVFDHMVEVRQVGFEFKEEAPQFDWDNLTPEEGDDAMKQLDQWFDKDFQDVKRYKALIPGYANEFLDRYLQADNEKMGSLGIQDVLSILNYLENGFEVDMNTLERRNHTTGIVEFSTGNYPFGGLERFLMVLKAFGLTPIECYDGFTIFTFNWTSDFAYEAVELPEKTIAYLKKLEN